RNLIFLMIWIFICFSAGYFAHWSGKNKFLYKRFEKWFQSASIEIREESLNKLPLKFRLPLMWSRCSRCMSYSLGGILSFTAALFYFYRPAWAAGLYFLFLGASTASAFAMFLYFREEWILYKKENQH
ncbi:MAG: hypothetical protein OEZ34_15630, partial [Spirochaetia bacterium]|nr:hypothetical protein [Spirochaetia bacterium]